LTASANHLKLWTQLSLLAKLEISSSLSLNHLSIRIHRNTYSNASVSRPRGWNLDVVDIIPPESVLCAEFQRLRINLDFNKITPQPSRRFGGDETLASRPSLERPKSPPKSPKSLGEIEWPHNKPADHPKRTNKFQHHSNDVHQNLTAWYNSHVEWPYPTNSEKEELQLQNGLSRSTFFNPYPRRFGQSADYLVFQGIWKNGLLKLAGVEERQYIRQGATPPRKPAKLFPLTRSQGLRHWNSSKNLPTLDY
jgi:hypothetical protein